MTAIDKWLKRYFDRRTTRRYDPNKLSLFIGNQEIKGYCKIKEIDDNEIEEYLNGR